MLHMQVSVDHWPRAVEALPPGSLVKAVDRGDILRDSKAINPDVTTMLRHVGGPQNIFWGDLEFNKQLAVDFFETFIDETFRKEYAQHTDLVQEWNEYLASSHTGAELQARLTWAEACAWVWKNVYRTQPEFRHIRLALVNAPVGNDIHRRFAEIALEYDCVLSYHAYDKFLGLNERDPLSWRWHCGRWHYMEEDWGLKPDWVFGEAGPYASVTDGWRSGKVLGGNREAYVAAVRTWVRELAQTPAYKEGRLKGFGLFTTGQTDGGWDDYYTEQPELDMLAEMLAAEWEPGSGVVLPPPPKPDPEPAPPDRVRIVKDILPRHPDLTYGIRPLEAIENIIIHHSDAPADRSPDAIAAYHVDTNDWPGIGYHFYILGDGTIYQTNNLTTHSYHAGPWNLSSVGVALAGDFTSVGPSPAQLEAARFLLAWLEEVFPEAPLLPHREVIGTECPGETWATWWPALRVPQPEPEELPPIRVTYILIPPWRELSEQETAAVVDLAADGVKLPDGTETDGEHPVTPSHLDFFQSVLSGTEGSRGIILWGDRIGTGLTPEWVEENLPETLERLIWLDPEVAPGTMTSFALSPPIKDIPLTITSGWRTRRIYQGVEYEHEGIDLRAVRDGRPVTIVAAAGGVVDRRAYSEKGYGHYIRLRHEADGGTRFTWYAHLSAISEGIEEGAAVAAGQQLGIAGDTGNSDGVHLHFGLEHVGHGARGRFIQGDWIDPTPWLFE
ncbi:MAG: peptidoglycan DD-metalloendopeptidase family protein [Chloroflexota bacterium]